MAEQITRKSILAEAEKCVCTDREEAYGSPEDNFYTISKLWNAYLGDNVTDEQDVAMMMALLKIARIRSGRFKEDSFVDACGYISIGGELGGKRAKQSD